LRTIRVKLPKCVREQRKIARILQTIDRAIEKTEALIDKYQQIKAGLMHDLFTRGIGPDSQLRPPREQAPELYQETPIGWIPKEWHVRSLGELCSQIADCPHSTPTYRGSGIPCIRTADMLPGKLDLDKAYCVDEHDYFNRIQRLKPREGDVIYSREGERLGIASPVGREPVCLGQRVMILRPSESVDASFLLWMMNHDDFYRRVTRGLGATTSPHVNVGDIQRMPVFVPDLSEQAAIGMRLSSVQVQLDSEKAIKNKMEKNKYGLMHDLLTGKVPVQVEEPESQPEASHV
jgi:type I restriction enzyme S subunit